MPQMSMALPGHSPPPFVGPGSPPRRLHGHNDSHLPPPMYGPPRPMLPPSPQHFQPRHQNAVGPSPSPLSFADSRPMPLPPPPYKRPGSGMSISSMLDGVPDRPSHELYSNHLPNRPGSLPAPSMALDALMSPPQQPTKPGNNLNIYKPRSHSPDHVGGPFGPSRQRSASSSMTVGPHKSLYDAHDGMARLGGHLYAGNHDGSYIPAAQSRQSDQEERARRTSLSGILQRPSSQPRLDIPSAPPVQSISVPPAMVHMPNGEATRSNGTHSNWDTRPPGYGTPGRNGSRTQTSPHASSQSTSPQLRRPNINGTQSRGLSNLLNGTNTQSSEPQHAGSQPMVRQDSTQSQNDRLAYGDKGRFRAYSPFNPSMVPQSQLNIQIDDPGRKGSDEIAHRAIVGLGLESRRSRYSPVPQAVQGAQAQTPVPDGGIKSEHGRVFSGIGSALSTTPTGSTPTSGPTVSSQTKKDEVGAPPTEGHSGKKATGNPSHTNKRARKVQDEASRADGDSTHDGKKPGAVKVNKRTKYQNSYKADLEEMAAIQRRNTPTATPGARRTLTPLNSTSGAAAPRYGDTTPIFKPKQLVKVAAVMSSVAANPRRHLGSFNYEPQVHAPEQTTPGAPDFDVTIRPTPLPAFTEASHLNCTYTVRVSKVWLQDTERRLIGTAGSLWGSGIYSDDSDPIAAAMHAGWLRARINSSADINLLQRVIDEQNPRVEYAREFRPPARPMEVESGKDLKITLAVMPQLDHYADSVRFGIRSRSWPQAKDTTPHDGASFAILKVEFVHMGAEERRSGRTGKEKRARLQAQIGARVRAAESERQRIALVQKRQAKTRRKATGGRINRGTPQNAISTLLAASETHSLTTASA